MHMDRSFIAPTGTDNGRRSIRRFLEPLLSLTGVQTDFLGSFEVGEEKYSLPRFTFRGPNSSDPIRIGVFAAIHGDEPAGALAAARFLLELAREPALAENFHLQIYPLCNPTGFEDNPRQSRRGRDLNREFWRASAEARQNTRFKSRPRRDWRVLSSKPVGLQRG